MNERIKEFAFDARLITVDGITRYATDYEFEKRFAELIVRECIKAYNDDGYQTEYEQDQKVLKHFGVEE
jgi:hypothetical protein